MTTSDELQKVLESIDDKLSWLLKLRVEEHFVEGATNQEKVEMMYRMGFGNQEMAELINTTTSSIRATLSNLRKEGVIEDE